MKGRDPEPEDLVNPFSLRSFDAAGRRYHRRRRQGIKFSNPIQNPLETKAHPSAIQQSRATSRYGFSGRSSNPPRPKKSVFPLPGVEDAFRGSARTSKPPRMRLSKKLWFWPSGNLFSQRFSWDGSSAEAFLQRFQKSVQRFELLGGISVIETLENKLLRSGVYIFIVVVFGGKEGFRLCSPARIRGTRLAGIHQSGRTIAVSYASSCPAFSVEWSYLHFVDDNAIKTRGSFGMIGGGGVGRCRWFLGFLPSCHDLSSCPLAATKR